MSRALLITMSLANTQSAKKEWSPPISDELLGPILRGTALSDEQIGNIPPRMIIKPLGRDVPDIIGWATGPYFVSEAVKQMLLSIDNDICKFVPIEMVQYKRKKEITHEYYMIVVEKIVDAVDVEASDIKRHLIPAGSGVGEQELFSIDTYRGKCVVRKDAIAGLHLWRNTEPFRSYVFCSGMVADTLRRNSSKGWRLIQCEIGS